MKGEVKLLRKFKKKKYIYIFFWVGGGGRVEGGSGWM